MFCASVLTDLVIFSLTSLISGQPLFAAVPGTSGHLSSSSFTPSLSLSGIGQPSYLAIPATLRHLSLQSMTPSPSVSILQGSGFGVSTTTSFFSSTGGGGGGGGVTVVACTGAFFLPNNLNFNPTWIF